MKVVSQKSTVLVLDPEHASRCGLVHLVNSHPRLRVCAEAEEVATARTLCTRHNPALVLVDIEADDAFSFLKDLRKWSRRARAVVHTRLGDAATVQRAIEAGAIGYVLRRDPAEALIAVLLSALAGERHVGPRIEHVLLDRIAQHAVKLEDDFSEALSPREGEVFRLLGEGCTTRELAARLRLSPKTVETHVDRIKLKLGFASGAELRRRAMLARAGGNPRPARARRR